MEGSKWYGKTNEGKYMTEQAAIAEGDKKSGDKNETAKPQQ